jgi:hypothetical protein
LSALSFQAHNLEKAEIQSPGTDFFLKEGKSLRALCIGTRPRSSNRLGNRLPEHHRKSLGQPQAVNRAGPPWGGPEVRVLENRLRKLKNN